MNVGLLHAKPFNASRGTVLKSSETIHSDSLPELTLSGTIISAITEIMDLMSAEDFIRAPNPALQFIAQVVKSAPPDLQSSFYLGALIASTADQTMGDSRARECIAQRVQDCGDYLAWWSQGETSTSTQLQDPLRVATKELPGGAYYDCLMKMCTGRRYYFTEESFGIAPALAQKGDLVCILFGGNVPYVLRKVGAKYLFIGDYYLYGSMDGEAVSKQRMSVTDVVDFSML
jgi:hypothetical protein